MLNQKHLADKLPKMSLINEGQGPERHTFEEKLGDAIKNIKKQSPYGFLIQDHFVGDVTLRLHLQVKGQNNKLRADITRPALGFTYYLCGNYQQPDGNEITVIIEPYPEENGKLGRAFYPQPPVDQTKHTPISEERRVELVNKLLLDLTNSNTDPEATMRGVEYFRKWGLYTVHYPLTK